MTNRFIIATDTLNTGQIKALKAALGEAGWWYWLPNFWLVVDPSDELSAPSIRDHIQRINDQARAIVIEVEPKIWAALTKPAPNGTRMEQWLLDTWDNAEL